MSIARVNTDYLTGAADAIRRKIGSQNPIQLTQFENEIDNIPTATLTTKTITQNGTYAAEDDNADGYSEVTVAVPRKITKLVDGTITEYVDDEITSIRSYVFTNCSNLQKVHCNNVKTIGARVFVNCRSLTDVEFNSVESIGTYCFENVGLNDPSKYPYRFPNVTTLAESSFRNLFDFYGQPTRGCFFPKLTNMRYNSFINAFKVFVFKSKTTISGTSSFLSDANLYIPQALWSWYINDTNWAAIYASYSNKFHTIEDNLDYLISIGFTREELLSVEE